MPGGSGAERRVDARRIATEGDHHRHRLAPFGHLAPVRGADLVALPVHRQVARPLHLHAVHPDVAQPRDRIPGDHHRQRDVAAAIARPGLQVGSSVEVDLVALEHHFLAGRLPPEAAAGTWPARRAWGASRACPQASGTLRLTSSVIRSPISSSCSTPSARQIRRIGAEEVDRHRDLAGCRLGRTGRSKSSAGPAAGRSSCSGRRSRRSRGGCAPAR